MLPRRLGLLLTDRGRSIDPNRQLESVVVLRGEPSAAHSRVGQAACQRQVRYWEAQASVKPVTRPLKYYPLTDRFGNTTWEGREKGIDVLIALAMVMGAMRDEFDVAILASCDTDLVPALETVNELGKICEVSSWQSRTVHRSRLSIPGHNLWCHWMSEKDYRFAEDSTDYTLAQTGDPPTS